MGNVERVMERVHRLLAIANDPAASDNEQHIALEQAQRLMNKHAIEEWQLEEDHDDVEIIERRIRLETNPCNRYMAQLANIVAHGNRCRAAYECRRATTMKGNTTKMYWERYIDRRNPRRIEPLDKPIDTYIMLDTETTGLHPEEGATLIEIGALFVQPGNENSRPKFEQLIDPQHPLTEFITGLTGITDRMLQGMPTAGAAMMRFHQWIDHVWPAGEPLTIIAHNAQFDVSFLDAAERVYDPTSPVFDCKWACTKEMSWELNPQKRHHRVADLIVDYHIGDVEEHRALSDAIQEQMLYQALCAEATRRGKWNERED
ncbi:hypothetical protein MCC01947_17790 [Bifidobacteriaceae bacterium MCC01947]|nr:hypothetical protein MCC01943_01920 [Bifidobacteriaceae bacterium MCC01943]GDY98504.1 hypothetical protein MCC01947_17790 [Bifidobacteriaceae bacterium MCC01947]GDZ01881.1 hypothetical protein MCC01941_11320 [Bifidobacteriaceae bacterium MCC01941]